MPDEFTEFLDRAHKFYGELAQNNSKDWFEPRKAAWKADIEGPARLLGEIMAEEVSRLTGAGHSYKLFRINRDVRFSKDKSPYKTMLAMLWSSGGTDGMAPFFYFGVHSDRTFVGCGYPGFDKDGLTRYRAMVDRKGDDLADTIEATGLPIADFGPDPLKRVPKPFDQDHPHADLLKRKALAIGGPLPDGWRDAGLVPALSDRFALLVPFRSFLATHI